jgi:hypothetical protein
MGHLHARGGERHAEQAFGKGFHVTRVHHSSFYRHGCCQRRIPSRHGVVTKKQYLLDDRARALEPGREACIKEIMRNRSCWLAWRALLRVSRRPQIAAPRTEVRR